MTFLTRDYNLSFVPTVDDLPPTYAAGQFVLVQDPPTLYVHTGTGFVPMASLEGATIPPATVAGASETEAGIAEIATQAETDDGLDNSRIVTPSKLANRTATEARAGVVELATSAESASGTDSTRAVHPAGLKAATTPEAWIAPTLLNGWVNFGAPNATAGYRKTPWGEVQLKGLIKSGTLNTTALTLPAGYRPAETHHFAAASQSTTIPGSVSVDASGNVVLVTGSNAWISLANVRFPAS